VLPAEHELEQLRLLYVSLTRAKEALVVSRPLKIRRGRIAALGLTARTAGSSYWQQLQQCRFFSDVPASRLPPSVDGASWSGIAIDADRT
jgi:ATP-dependent exoDNAse (exonuclease V) beta subunit